MSEKSKAITTLTKTTNKLKFAAQKHGPQILMIAGVVGTVVGAVLACRATTKVNDILDKSKEDIDSIHECAENEELEEYSKNDENKDLAIVYVQTGVKLVKLYSLSFTVEALSIIAILESNNILKKRNAALAAAYTTINEGFSEYRSRVKEKFGDEADRELRYNIKTEKVNRTVVDEETGKKKKTKETIETVDPADISDYARIFDERNVYWEKGTDYNMMFLKSQENYANDRLKAYGYLFLNDVYEMLGFEHTKAGQVVGWIYDPRHPNGDNYVDFGIYELNKDYPEEEEYGNILLDFNVDGNIFEKCW